MNMSHVTKAWVLLLVGVTLVAGCARSPEAKKARHLERGDKYFSKAEYREALIEYANVLQLDQANPRAIRQLALAHYQLGQMGQAFPYLVKSQELDPGDADIQSAESSPVANCRDTASSLRSDRTRR